MSEGNYQGGKGQVIALDEALDRWHAEADEEEAQLGLFAPPQTEAGQALARPYKRGPGRPPGSRNKRTERTVAFLLARHRDPREILLEMAEANVHDLAALYGCSAFEAAQEKRLAAIALLPYLAQRQPLSVDVTRRSVVYLSIEAGAIRQVGEGDNDAFACAVKVLDAPQFIEQEENIDECGGKTGGEDAAGSAEDIE